MAKHADMLHPFWIRKSKKDTVHYLLLCDPKEQKNSGKYIFLWWWPESIMFMFHACLVEKQAALWAEFYGTFMTCLALILTCSLNWPPGIAFFAEKACIKCRKPGKKIMIKPKVNNDMPLLIHNTAM